MQYPTIVGKSLVILFQFSTTYLYESGFSTVTYIKTKKRENLKTVDEEMGAVMGLSVMFYLNHEMIL